MSEPIKVGDLVQVVRACCDGYPGGVWIYRVAGFRYAPIMKCALCFKPLPRETFAQEVSEENGVPISWLKRIPPLSELDDVKKDEEISA